MTRETPKLVLLQIKIGRGQRRAWRAAARRQHLTVSELVRRAVALSLEAKPEGETVRA